MMSIAIKSFICPIQLMKENCMRKSIGIALAALFAVLLATAVVVTSNPAFAQDATPTPAAEEESDAATPTTEPGHWR